MRILLLVVAMVLAGCSEAPTDPTVVTEQDIEAGSAAPLPEWTKGMYWEFQHSVDGEPSDVATYVVTDVGASTYTLDVNNKQTAFFDALMDISFVGEIRKSDLAGQQGGNAVAMFEFPLTGDKEWTTTWDGDQLNMKSSNMGPMQFHVMGHRTSDDQMVVEYHYNALKSWFEYIIFYNGTTGAESFRMSLNSHGDDFRGDVYRYTLGETRVFAATAADSGIHDVEFDAEWNELRVQYDFICNGDAQGQSFVGFNTPEKAQQNPFPMMPGVNEPDYGSAHNCADGATYTGIDVMANEGGTWQMGLLAGGPNTLVHVMVDERRLDAITL